MTATDVFGLIGLLLIIGFLADYLFRKTNFPDILILLGLGYLVGPVLHLVDPSQLAPAAEIIASLALVVIIFNGGIEFELSKVLRTAPRALILVILGVAVSVAAVAAPAYFLYGWKLLDAILLGTVVGGTSSAIIMPMVAGARVSPQASSLLSLESVFNSPIIIVVALITMEAIAAGQSGVDLGTVGIQIGIRVAIGIAAGVILGFLWVWVQILLRREEYNDILNLAVVFTLYFVVENINGSGVIFALVFGLILGNGVSVARLFKLKRASEDTLVMKKFTAQIYFMIKTFFFIYLGLIITFSAPLLIAAGVIASLLLLLGRHIAVLFTVIGNGELWRNRGLLTLMMARGESAAVLVQLVVASKITHAEIYPDFVMTIILATVLISAVGILVYGRRSRQPEEDSGRLPMEE